MTNFKTKTKLLSGKWFYLPAVFFVLFQLTFAYTANAQELRVSGTITDSKTGEGIPGATVAVKGTAMGTVSDAMGNFNLMVPARDAVLSISFVGYTTQEVPVDGRTTVNVVLETADLQLEEVVAIGYGVVKKRDLTGAVSSVKAADIERVASSNAMQAVQAKVPGLDIQQSDGQAGAGLSMTLRGTRSLSASNSPLILVDGVEYGSTIDINATDIESMEILKDAASTAIYGTKGANGVIIITTKRGKAGKTRVSLNAYVSSNIPTNYVKPLFGQNEVQALIDKKNYIDDLASGNWGTAGNTAEDVLGDTPDNIPVGQEFTTLDVYNDGRYADWLDIILQNGLTKNYEASISGGNEKTNFNVSLGTMFEEGLMKNDNLDRYNGSILIDHRVSEFFKVGGNVRYVYRSHNSRNSNVFTQSLKMTSISRPYNQDGSVLVTPNAMYKAHANPLLDEVDGNWQRNRETTRFFGNTYLEVTPLKGLNFRSMFALDRSNVRYGTYADYESVGRFQSPHTSSISLEYTTDTKYTWDNTLTYNFSLGENELTAMVGSSAIQSVNENMLVSGDAGTEHYYKSSFYDISKISTSKPVSGYVKSSMLSFFGRLHYSYAGKYILTATIRRDGSSALAAGNQWGNFPSLAGAWRLSDEAFMEGAQDWLSNLKVRASWGISGNAAIDPYTTLAMLGNPDYFPNLYYYIGGKDIVGRVPSQMGNKDLKWETTSSIDFGIDFGLFNNRVSGSVDYYQTETSDLLYLKTAPASSVFPSVLSNVGSTKGHGLEIALNATPVRTNNFSYDFSLSYTTNKDEVVFLNEGIEKNIVGQGGQIVGQPVSIYWDYEADGIWDVGEFAEYKTAWEGRHSGETMAYVANYGAPGTLKVVDRNDDGKLNEDDKMVYNRAPKHIIGLNNNFSYKNFSLSVMLYARLGGWMSYDLNNQIYFEPQWTNWGDLDYWTPDNPDAKFPSPGALAYSSINNGEYKTSLKYEKADYFKVKDITLSYSLPKSLLNNVKISDVKIYGSLKNYFTFSAVGDNYDSERGGAVSFPLAKQAVLGVNIGF